MSLSSRKVECRDPGHLYVANGKFGSIDQYTIVFMKNEKDHAHDGITNEQVLEILIDRLTYLNTTKKGKFRCKENVEALEHLESALRLLDQRTADREKRGVEGTQKP